MADHLSGRGGPGLWGDEGGNRNSAAYFRERETHCRTRADECHRSEMRSTYLGFAARYAALARYLEAGSAEAGLKLTIV